ncbi:MAG TPA: prepilin-type N-terminal cleavage/methylation domain-containing protein [Burkholderiaceae bacterium]|nr:prepilin-type N-terminal cleavage/methylation domain-containing protein [Burkholderiaceae bacterium]
MKITAPSAAGFTLLELMVVIVLAGILISLVTVNIAPDPRQQLQREAQRVGQLMALAADESRITQQPIVWEADLRGYRFVTESGGERRLLTGDDLLRERAWETRLTRLAVLDNGGPQPAQVLLGPGAPPVRVGIAREWIQPRWRLELTSEDGSVRVDFDEAGRALLAMDQVKAK